MVGDALKGHLDSLILAVLAAGPLHGYAAIEELKRRSAGTFDLPEGTVYPALHQMERDGLLKASWRDGPTGRARKYYGLTAKGRRRADSKRKQWASISGAMRAILGDAHA